MDIKIYINCNNSHENFSELISQISHVKAEDDIPAVRFLGVYLDPSLNFNFHAKLIASKLSKSLYILRSVKNILPPKSLKLIYHSLFHSNLIYCLPAWSCTSLSNINKIFLLQKAAIRVITKAKYNAHTEPLFKSLNILPLEKLIIFFNLQFMQHYKQGFLPASFNNIWLTNSERRNEDLRITLRNDQMLAIPYTRLQNSQKFPLIVLPKTWINFQNEDVKIIRNKKEFNSSLKTHLLSELSAVIICNRLLCPNCHLNNDEN